MSDTRELQQSRMGISTDKFQATATGLHIVGEPSYEEWYDFGHGLAKMDGAIQWWIGDWAAAEGRVVNGVKSEAYDLLEAETGLAYGTVANCKSIAEKVDLSRRDERLSFKHHATVAPLAPDRQAQWLQKAADEGLTVAQLRREIRVAAYEEPELPDGKYRVLYCDPPWDYHDQQSKALSEHYASMTTEQLCEMDVSRLSADDAVLFLWSTVPMLPDAMRLLEAWGFTYKTQMVWDKVKHNVGHYVSVRHELLLIATRGVGTPDTPELVDSVYVEERTEHSRKPIYFRDLIDKLYPGGKRIELFAREELPSHWDGWGNEYSTG